MWHSGGGAAPEREYLFIDGGCLRASVRTICRDMFDDENAFQPLISSVAGGSYNKVFYYDAVPGRDHGEDQAVYEARVKPDHDRFARIQALDRVHVALGQIVGKDRRQKGVDVRLAVDMLTHAFRHNISKATLFAGDADFIPLVRALVQEGIHVTLWHPSQANADLKGAADSTRLFSFKANFDCFTTDGAEAAFSPGMSASGGINPNSDGIDKAYEFAGIAHAATWEAGKLRVWRNEAVGNWAFIDLVTNGPDLALAIKVFNEIYGWEIGANDTSWVIQR